jgi:putative methionine-R-sulfoxide reductase with GAF domain
MHGSAQPEPTPESPSAARDAGPTRATGGFGTNNAPEGRLDNSGNSESDSDENYSERRALDESELTSTLQLLVERAQYITGATGTALALPQGDEMVCRASAGASAPAVGARLQVKSGLTGESISRRQLLRCDNAEADPRVNLEACRALGIASIVVLPLLRNGSEVRGLFELFSDHPYAFEERDLIALERMAALTLTALDLAEQRQHLPSAQLRRTEATAAAAKPDATKLDAIKPDTIKPDAIKPGEDAIALIEATAPMQQTPPAANSVGSSTVRNMDADASHRLSASPGPHMPEPLVVKDLPPVLPSRDIELGNLVLDAEDEITALPMPDSAQVPSAMLRVQKCATCGFPVSEGRTLCLDCEKKGAHDKNDKNHKHDKNDKNDKNDGTMAAKPTARSTDDALPKQSTLTQPAENDPVDKPLTSQSNESSAGTKSDTEDVKIAPSNIDIAGNDRHGVDPQNLATASGTADEFVPAFLANSAPFRESWLSRNYVNLLAVVVLILCILVAIVIFR